MPHNHLLDATHSNAANIDARSRLDGAEHRRDIAKCHVNHLLANEVSTGPEH